jgi:hypothetical protein
VTNPFGVIALFSFATGQSALVIERPVEARRDPEELVVGKTHDLLLPAFSMC